MQEIEAKFYVTNLSRIESQLRDLDAQLVQPRILESNIRFDLPDARLRSERRVLRLRTRSAKQHRREEQENPGHKPRSC